MAETQLQPRVFDIESEKERLQDLADENEIKYGKTIRNQEYQNRVMQPYIAAREENPYFSTDWEKVKKATSASIKKAVETGNMPIARAKERLDTLGKETEEKKSAQSRQKALKTAENIADVATTVGGTALLFTPAAPVGLGVLGAQSASSFTRAAMSDSKKEKEEYEKAGMEQALTTAAIPVLGKAIGLGAKLGSNIAKSTISPKGMFSPVNKVTQTVLNKLNKIEKTGNVSGKMVGGVLGLETGAAAITPDDNMATATLKATTGAVVGSLVGGKVAEKLTKTFPILDVPVSTAIGAKNRTAGYVAHQIETGIKATPTGIPYAGTRTVTTPPEVIKTKKDIKIQRGEGGIDVPATLAFDPSSGTSTFKIGRWKPAEGSQEAATPLRQLAKNMDYGVPTQSTPIVTPEPMNFPQGTTGLPTMSKEQLRKFFRPLGEK